MERGKRYIQHQEHTLFTSATKKNLDRFINMEPYVNTGIPA